MSEDTQQVLPKHSKKQMAQLQVIKFWTYNQIYAQWYLNVNFSSKHSKNKDHRSHEEHLENMKKHGV